MNILNYLSSNRGILISTAVAAGSASLSSRYPALGKIAGIAAVAATVGLAIKGYCAFHSEPKQSNQNVQVPPSLTANLKNSTRVELARNEQLSDSVRPLQNTSVLIEPLLPKISHSILITQNNSNQCSNLIKQISGLPKEIQKNIRVKENYTYQGDGYALTGTRVELQYDKQTILALADKYTIIRKLVYGANHGDRNIYTGYMCAIDGCQIFSIDEPAKPDSSGLSKFFENPSLRSQRHFDNVVPEDQILPTVFRNHRGLCVGESHFDSLPKTYLMENMKTLVRSGVDTIFLEHLCHDGLQAELDAYLSSQCRLDQMPKALEARLLQLGTGYQSNAQNPSIYKDLVVSAKRAGIKRVVAIDSEASYQAGTSSTYGVTDSKVRYRAMNYQAAQIIDHYRRQGIGKFVVFTGNAHTTTCEGVAGMSQILQVPSLLISSLEVKNSNYHQNHTWNISKEVSLSADFVLFKRATIV